MQKRFTTNFADDAKKEYKDFLKVVVKPNKRLFMDFNMDKERLDDFFMKFLNGVNRFSKIAEVVKFVLTLSHGQAAVERGFSISEKTLFENFGNDNLMTKHIVIDHMLTHDLKAYDLPITRELLSSVRSAHSKYVAEFETCQPHNRTFWCYKSNPILSVLLGNPNFRNFSVVCLDK